VLNIYGRRIIYQKGLSNDTIKYLGLERKGAESAKFGYEMRPLSFVRFLHPDLILKNVGIFRNVYPKNTLNCQGYKILDY